MHPSYANAVNNFRIVPGDSIASVVKHVKQVIRDDCVEGKVVRRFSAEPPAVSSKTSAAFLSVERVYQRALQIYRQTIIDVCTFIAPR